MITAFSADDGMDYDEGYRGLNQFPFVVGCQGMDHGGEHDGGTTPEDGEPFANTLTVNATYIGAGKGSGQKTFALRDNWAGAYYNSFFYDHGTYGIDIENLVKKVAEPPDSRDRLIEGNLLFRNNYWWKMGNGNLVTQVCNNDDTVKKYVFDNASLNNHVMEVHVRNVSRIQDQMLDPRICNDTLPWVDPMGVDGYVPFNPTGYPNAVDVNWPAMAAVDYVGAFDPDVSMASQWTAGWTFLDWGGYLGDYADCNCCRNRGNADGVIGPAGPVDVADVTFLVACLFQGGSPPNCSQEANVDGVIGPGGPVDVADVTYLVAFLFQSGTPPPACP
jgi:hypothetical protein